jgi:ribosome-binding protein aMBF1 (putative translation factor)
LPKNSKYKSTQYKEEMNEHQVAQKMNQEVKMIQRVSAGMLQVAEAEERKLDSQMKKLETLGLTVHLI